MQSTILTNRSSQMDSGVNQRSKRARTAAATAESVKNSKVAAPKKAKTSAAKKAPAPKKNPVPKKKADAAVPAAASPAPAPAPAPASSKAKPATSKKKSGPLETGMDAPAFCVKDQDGYEVTLASFKGKCVVVFFYPKDNTPGCTKEACKFRDLKDEYDALDCAVLGVSADHSVSHGKFISKFGLNFSLLADTNRSLIKSYGASKAGDRIQRSTVLIDKEGKVAAVWNPVSGAEQHPVQVLAKLKEIVSA